RLADGPATDAGWVDVVRALHPDEEGPFSWWTWRGKAFDTGAGWRIDYQMATPDLAARAQRAWVDRAEAYDLRWSDHSPVLVEYR
ncbi:exodeoxyribonuclease III, partial [Corynebacterium bovis]